MKKNKGIICILFVAMSSVVLMSISGIQKEEQAQRIRHCFDVAFDSIQSRLFAVSGYKGMHVFNVSDGKLSYVTSYYDEGYYRNIKISGNHAFVADTNRGLLVFDISKKIPVLTWKWKDSETKTRGFGIHVEDNFAYLAQGLVDENDIKLARAGLYIFDVSAPDAPELIGQCQTENAWDVCVIGGYAYVADFHGGLCVIDVSSISNPRVVNRLKWKKKYPGAEIIRSEDEWLYVAAGRRGLIVIDVSNPKQPEIKGIYKSGRDGYAEGLCVKDQIVYLANGNKKKREENGLFIIDAHRPDSLEVRGRCAFLGWVEGVCYAGKHIFVANWDSGVRSINISNLEKPQVTDHFGSVVK